MNVAGSCSAASENESSQTLAIVLSIVFTLYVGSAILLSSLQLYTITSESTSSRADRAQPGESVGIPLIASKT